MQNEVISAKETQLIDAINAGYKEVMELADAVKEGQQTAINKAAQVGALLSQAKDQCPKKQGGSSWCDWLKVNCPTIPRATAERWIKLSTVDKLDSYMSQRLALTSLNLLPDTGDNSSREPTDKANPSYLTFVQRIKCVFTEEVIEQLTPEQRIKIADDLAPIVALYQILSAKPTPV